MALNVESKEDPAEPPSRRRAVFAAAAGTLVENYDNFLYGILVVAISTNLFPPGANAPLGALATFAVSFLARPVGAIIFGRIADRRGRRPALILSLVAMTLGTVLVGALPTYASVGMLAPVLLVCLRLLQGVSMGGELGSASIFIGEYASRTKRGFLSSLVYMSAMCGNIGAVLVVLALQAVLAPADFGAWGWRIAFLLAALPALVIIYIRVRTEETPLFRALDEASVPEHVSLGYALRRNWRQIIQIALLNALGAPYLLVAAYLPIYFTKAGLTTVGATLSILVINVVLTVLVPLAGSLGDRIGRKRLLVGSGAAMVVLVVPAFSFAGAGSVTSGIIGGLVLIIPIALYFGAYPSAIAEMFSTESRGTGGNIGYAVGSSLFAALPLVVAAISATTGDKLVPAYCVLVTAAIGLAASLTLPSVRLSGEHDLADTRQLQEEHQG